MIRRRERAIAFGDKDPEDAWDDGDSLEQKLAILERVIIALRASKLNKPRRDDALRLVAKLEIEHASKRLAEIRYALESLR